MVMGMREKLIELLIAAQDLITLSRKADFLIANDVVPVVRCKDCKHEQKCLMCIEVVGDTPLTTSSRHIDFCSYGERKDNGI
jgi:hypothetical protein